MGITTCNLSNAYFLTPIAIFFYTGAKVATIAQSHNAYNQKRLHRLSVTYDDWGDYCVTNWALKCAKCPCQFCFYQLKISLIHLIKGLFLK